MRMNHRAAVAASFAIIWTQTNCLWGGGEMTCRWSGTVKLHQPAVTTLWKSLAKELERRPLRTALDSAVGFFLSVARGGRECLSQRTFRSARGRITLTWTRLQRKLTAHMEHCLHAWASNGPLSRSWRIWGPKGVRVWCACACGGAGCSSLATNISLHSPTKVSGTSHMEL